MDGMGNETGQQARTLVFLDSFFGIRGREEGSGVEFIDGLSCIGGMEDIPSLCSFIGPFGGGGREIGR